MLGVSVDPNAEYYDVGIGGIEVFERSQSYYTLEQIHSMIPTRIILIIIFVQETGVFRSKEITRVNGRMNR